MRVCRPSKKAPPRLSNATGLSWVSLLSALDDRGRSPLAWAFGSRCRSEHVTIFCSWDWSHHWIVDPFVPHFDFAPRIRAETIQSSRLLSTKLDKKYATCGCFKRFESSCCVLKDLIFSVTFLSPISLYAFIRYILRKIFLHYGRFIHFVILYISVYTMRLLLSKK